jgi:hypothetical protein
LFPGRVRQMGTRRLGKPGSNKGLPMNRSWRSVRISSQQTSLHTPSLNSHI